MRERRATQLRTALALLEATNPDTHTARVVDDPDAGDVRVVATRRDGTPHATVIAVFTHARRAGDRVEIRRSVPTFPPADTTLVLPLIDDPVDVVAAWRRTLRHDHTQALLTAGKLIPEPLMSKPDDRFAAPTLAQVAARDVLLHATTPAHTMQTGTWVDDPRAITALVLTATRLGSTAPTVRATIGATNTTLSRVTGSGGAASPARTLLTSDTPRLRRVWAQLLEEDARFGTLLLANRLADRARGHGWVVADPQPPSQPAPVRRALTAPDSVYTFEVRATLPDSQRPSLPRKVVCARLNGSEVRLEIGVRPEDEEGVCYVWGYPFLWRTLRSFPRSDEAAILTAWGHLLDGAEPRRSEPDLPASVAVSVAAAERRVNEIMFPRPVEDRQEGAAKPDSQAFPLWTDPHNPTASNPLGSTWPNLVSGGISVPDPTVASPVPTSHFTMAKDGTLTQNVSLPDPPTSSVAVSHEPGVVVLRVSRGGRSIPVRVKLAPKRARRLAAAILEQADAAKGAAKRRRVNP